MKNKLTDRQKEILEFIYEFRENYGYPPTLREIGKRFDISSTFGVKRHLDALEKKGHLTVESNASRGISLQPETGSDRSRQRDSQDQFVSIPLVGRVAAGSPILAEENLEGNITIDPSFIKRNSDSFALKVKGDSMINAGIFEGDIVIVESKQEARNGDIVVALINDEATVKTFEKFKNSIKLLPENEKYNPIEIKENDRFSLVGKVTGVIRLIN